MLDVKYIINNLNEVKKAANAKKAKVDFDRLLKLYEEKKNKLGEIEAARARRNELSGGGKKPTAAEVEEGKGLKEKITRLEGEQAALEEAFTRLMMQVPNVISPDTPPGQDENDNKVLRQWGEPKKFSFTPRDHMELGARHKIIETEKSGAIAGARFNYLFGEAVLLQFAILGLVFDTLTDEKIITQLAERVGNPSAKVFTPVVPPVMAKSEIMKKMDRFDPIEDRYYLKEDDLLLVGSAEHTLGPLHLDEIIPAGELPIRYIGYSTAFRREAGSYGKDTTGILRRHQFDKAEMETFALPENGLKEQELIVAIQEHLVQRLEIPYRVMAISSGDMGKPDYRQIDIECWIPSQGKFRETHTSDYMTDYQSRRLGIRYKTAAGEKDFVHMNDATAFAMGRILIALLENHQNEDGSIDIPASLHKYLPHGLKNIGGK